MSKDYLWVEKYRPKKVSDTVLPADIKKIFQEFVDTNTLSNMLLTGTAGTGKTTVARALCNELGLDYIIINGSEEGNIDTLRTKIKQFASSVSLQGGYKVIILDEADYLNPQSTQPALRGFIEEFSDNCRFILTCNFKNRIIKPLHSRCSVYEFNTTKQELARLCSVFLANTWSMLDSENIDYKENKNAIPDLIIQYAPDWRRIINELQRYSISGILQLPSKQTIDNFTTLFDYLKTKDFKKMRSWVATNVDIDSSVVFRALYDRLNDRLTPESIPQLILILANYQYKDAFVADHELNTVACLTEVMANVTWKN